MRRVVEFIGPPGAGKTTALHRTAAETDGAVVSLDLWRRLDGTTPDRRERLRERLGSAARQPRVTLATVRLVAPDRRLVGHMLEVPRRRAMLNRAPAGVWLVDEGPLQRLLWVLAMASWEGDVAQAARAATQADVLVVVDVNAEEAWARLERRGTEGSTALQMGRDAGVRALELFRRHLHRAMEVLEVPAATPKDATASFVVGDPRR
jgi:RecA/RadA recombinase